MLHRRNRLLQGKPMGMVEQKHSSDYDKGWNDAIKLVLMELHKLDNTGASDDDGSELMAAAKKIHTLRKG